MRTWALTVPPCTVSSIGSRSEQKVAMTSGLACRTVALADKLAALRSLAAAGTPAFGLQRQQ